MATRLAPVDLSSPRISCSASSSALQYGHQYPRKKVVTRGPRASRSSELTGSPRVFERENGGMASPTLMTSLKTPDSRKSFVARCMTFSAAGGIRFVEPSRIFDNRSSRVIYLRMMSRIERYSHDTRRSEMLMMALAAGSTTGYTSAASSLG